MSALLDLSAVQLRIKLIKACNSLEPPPPFPLRPRVDHTSDDQQSIADLVARIQSFIESFEYNYTGKPFVSMKKSRGMKHIVSVSEQLMKVALPIQCVEAVFLGAYLTAGIQRLDRIPLSFKTKFLRGSVHQHIVLAVRHDGGKWGAIGISRRPNLMYKDLQFDTLADLIEEYCTSYEACFHKLLTVYAGLPFPHDVHRDDPIKWRAVKIRVFGRHSSEVRARIDAFESIDMARLHAHFKVHSSLP